MKKVLFVTYTSSDHSSQGTRHRNIIKYLEKSVDLKVVRYENFISATDKISRSGSLISRLKKIIYRLFIQRCWFPDEFVLIRKWYINETLKFLNADHYDAIILGIVPFSFYPLARSVKSKFPSLKIIIDASDPFYGNVTVFHSRNYIKKKLAFNYEKKFLKYADHLVVLNEEIKEFYRQIFGMKEITVIEQGIDPALINNYELNDLSAGKPGKETGNNLVLVYGGMFYDKIREPFELYRAVDESNGKLKLKIYGKIKKKFLKVNSKHIEFHGRVSQEELFKAYEKADILVFIDNAFGIQVPGKAAELLLFNKPVIYISSNEGSPSWRYFDCYPLLLKAGNDSVSIKNELNEYLHREDHQNYSVYDVSEYYWDNQVSKYLEIIAETAAK